MRENLIATTSEIFSTMIMMDVSVGEIDGNHLEIFENSITGSVGLAGAHKGVVALHIPYEVAFAITSSFLGMEVTEVNEDVEDAIGELANMVGGSIKSFLSKNGGDIELSLPTTIAGKEYAFQVLKSANRIIVPFIVESGTFTVELQLEAQ